MRTVPPCLTCMLGDVYAAVQQVTADPAVQLAVAKDCLAFLADTFGHQRVPSYYITEVHRILKRDTGVEVQVEKIQKRDLEAIVSASGKIQARTTVNISANTMGRVTKLEVEEGNRVKAGQFLLEIDPRQLRTQVMRGEAGISAQQTAVAQARRRSSARSRRRRPPGPRVRRRAAPAPAPGSCPGRGRGRWR